MSDLKKMEKRLANLKRGNPETQFKSGQNAVENGRKGGIQNGKNHAEKRLLSEEILKRMSAADWEEIAANLVARAKDNDNSLTLLRDTIGQKPSEKAEIGVATVTLESFLSSVDDNQEDG